MTLLALVLSILANTAPERLLPQAAFERLCGGPDALPLEVAGSRHFVEVTLSGPKGTETLRFHVDTGGNTPGVLLPRSVATRLGFASESDLPKTLRIGSRDVPLPKGARWLLVDERKDPMRKGFSVGQLGAGFLSRFLVCIDPARGRLALADPKRFTVANDAAAIPLILQPGGPNRALYPFVFVRAGRGGYGMLLDTGATSSMLEHHPMDVLHQDNAAWPYVAGAAGDADMIGGAFLEHMLQADEVVLTFPKAAARFKVGKVLFVERPDDNWDQMFGQIPHTGGSHGAIANDVLNRYRLLIDYANARLWLEPSGRSPDRSASMTRVGLSLAFADDGCPVVRQIASTNADAVATQLKLGDVLFEADGRDLCKLWHHEIAALLAGDPKQVKTVRVRRGAEVLQLKLPVADLLR